ncbi:MAG TPA: hypothetical protein PLK99_10630, partial [Burkholderiales bacterium]|nr:hypothetical protein [Burkholderiales bacterium]
RQIQASRAGEEEQASLFREIRALYPDVASFILARGERQEMEGKGTPVLIAVVGSKKPLAKKDRMTLESWLSVKFPERKLHVEFETPKNNQGGDAGDTRSSRAR